MFQGGGCGVAGFHTRLPLFPQRQTGDTTAADNGGISAGTFGVGLQSHHLRAALIWLTSAALSGPCRGALSPEFPVITETEIDFPLKMKCLM